MTLGEHIARLRGEKQLSQGELADALGVSRQSVSKWETDASVPELDKLIRLSDLFGVTLDQLVRGEDKAQATPTPSPAPGGLPTARLVLGGGLLAAGVLGILLLTLFAGLGGLLFALLFLSPLVLCGVICLKARRHVGLWCAWAVYAPQQIYWSWATGLTWKTVRWTLWWTEEMNYMRLVIAWIMLAAMVGLVTATLWAFRRMRLAPAGKNLALAAGAWCAAALLLIGADYVPALSVLGGLRWGLTAVPGLAALAAALTLTLALVRGRRQNGPEKNF